MKRFCILFVLFTSLTTYSQTITADSAVSITSTSALLYGSHTRGTYDYTVEKDIQIDDNSDFSSPILEWTPCSRANLILSYQTASIFKPATQYHYRFRVTLLELDDESELTITSESNNFTTIDIDQASNIAFSNIQSNALTASYMSGNGGNRIVLVKEGSAVDSDPVDNTQYTSNSIFGSGQQIGTGNYVVAKGDNNNVTVTGLTAGVEYHFKVYEYLIDGTNRFYRTDGFDEVTDNPNSQITKKPEPTGQASNINFTSVGSSEVSLNWTAGNGDYRMVVVRADATAEVNPADDMDYAANAAIGSAGTTGAGNYVVYKGTGTSVTVTGLSPETNYHFKVYEFNNEGALSNYKIDGYPNGTNPNDTTTFKGQPAQASNLVFSNIGNNSMTVEWTSGGGDGAVLIAREGSAIADFPDDGFSYTADLEFGGTGSNLGNNTFVLYSGSATTANITGLTFGTTYYFMVCEYNNSGSATDYNTNPGTNNPESQPTLKNAPTTQASSIIISGIQTNQLTLTWTNGDGDRRIVLAKKSFPVNGIPSDATTYTANTVFGAGAQIGSGNYVVYNNNGNSVTITGLDPNATYHFKIFEYNNTGTDILFKTDAFSEFNPANAKTLPSLQATELVFSNVQNTSIDLSWSRGNGDSVLVVAKEGTTLTEIPTEGTIYSDNAIFGSGETIDTDVFVVYSGTGTSVSVSGLTASTDYIFKAFEFNNSEPNTAYLTNDDSNNPATQSTTGTEPSAQASAVSFTNTSSTQTDVSWTAGTGGSGRIVLAYKGDTATAIPSDGFTYTANAIFGSGSEIGTGNFVVALGDVTTETVTGLTPESEYKFRVFEYSGSGSSINYLTSLGTDNPDSVTTLLGKPVIQSDNITFTQLNDTSYQVNWTHGSGDSIIVVGVAGSFSSSENPVDETDYTADAAFGSGSLIGSGRVVYKGISADGSVIATNLTAATNYSFKVFEYNAIEGKPYYQTADGTSNPMSRFTLATEPNTQAGAVSFSSIGATQVTLDWTTLGDGSSVIVVAREAADLTSSPVDGTAYNSNNNFTAAEIYATDHHVVYNGTATGATITNLNPNTAYYFRAYAYNGATTTCNYLTSSGSSNTTTTIKAEPTVQAGNFSFTDLTTSSYTVNWERGNGDGIIILAKSGSAVDAIPVDGTDTYTAHATFSSGDELGTGNYVVYKGTGTSEAITFPESPVNYFFRAFEYTNSGAAVDYLTAIDSSASQYTLSTEPTTQVSELGSAAGTNSINIGWTGGNGTGRILLMKQSSAVNSLPVDGKTYTASQTFGVGSELGTGNFVVYAGAGEATTITGLLSTTTYYFQLFEYDDTGAINYNTTAGPSGNTQTGVKGEPTEQASAINFTSVGTTEFTINWTSGDGDSRIVVMRESTQGTIADPTDSNPYTASADWSSKGTQLESSGYYTVYNGAGNSVTVTNLTANTTYWVQIFEYNNITSFQNYLTSTDTDNPNSQATLKLAPETQASAIAITAITSTSASISWTNGSGDGRIVVARASVESIVNPADGTDYSANTVLGLGDATGTENYIIFNGSTGSVTVTGLDAGTSYTFVVYEYNNSGTAIDYNLTVTDDANSKDTTTLGTATWDGSTDSDWNTGDNWSTDEVPTSSQNVIIANVSNKPIIATSESYSVENVTIEAGASVTISDGASLSVSGDLLLENSSGTGTSGTMVIPGTGSLSVNGNTTLELYYPVDSIHYVCFPVTSPSMSVFYQNFAVNQWNENTASWSFLNSGSSLSQLRGYATNYRGTNPVLSFTGTFNNGTMSIGVSNASTSDGTYGWNLVGNPYPSVIDLQSSGWTWTNVDQTAYFYNGNSGSYATFNVSSGGTNGGTRYITPGQGFFVHANASSGTFGVSNAIRVAQSASFYKSGNNQNQLVRIKASNVLFETDMIIGFEDEASSNFDSKWDAFYLASTNENISDIYSLPAPEERLVINNYNSSELLALEEKDFIVPIALTPGNSGLVTIQISEITNLPSNLYIYLYDKLLDKKTNLKTGNVEVFITNTSETRFELIFTLTPLHIDRNDLKEDFLVFTKENHAFIKSTTFVKNKGMIYLYDISGRIITETSTDNSELQSIKIMNPGTYIIKVIVNNHVLTQKVVVR